MKYHARPMNRPSRFREAVEIVAFLAVLFGIVVAMSVVEPVR